MAQQLTDGFNKTSIYSLTASSSHGLLCCTKQKLAPAEGAVEKPWQRRLRKLPQWDVSKSLGRRASNKASFRVAHTRGCQSRLPDRLGRCSRVLGLHVYCTTCAMVPRLSEKHRKTLGEMPYTEETLVRFVCWNCHLVHTGEAWAKARSSSVVPLGRLNGVGKCAWRMDHKMQNHVYPSPGVETRHTLWPAVELPLLRHSFCI